MDLDDDDDDGMADLFSFGADGAADHGNNNTSSSNNNNNIITASSSAETAPTGGATTTTTTTNSIDNEDGSPVVVAATDKSIDALLLAEADDNDTYGMDDSFLKMLDEAPINSGNSRGQADANAAEEDPMNDQETQDILNWLDEDDTDADALLAAVADESAQKSQEKQQQQQQQQQQDEEQQQEKNEKKEEQVVASAATVVPIPPPHPIFSSLKEALESPEATKLQILEQWEQQEHSTLKDASLRPLLWSRLICSKTVDELTLSSLADSFQTFDTTNESHTHSQQQQQHEELQQWIRTEAAKLAPRVVRTSPTVVELAEAEEALQSIMMYHYHSNNNHNNSTNENASAESDTGVTTTTAAATTTTTTQYYDPLLPPVVCAILSAGVPKLAAPVLLSHIIPSFMPFVALTPEERWEASKLLHSQFYLLACYHLPMLVYHLDRYVPGWYWPQRPAPLQQKQSEKANTNSSANTNANDSSSNNDNGKKDTNHPTYKGRHLKEQGVIPPSWLMTHLVGECGGTFLDPNRLLQLLDLVFTNENNSLRFFLVLVVLEQHSDTWLELTGPELMESLLENMQDSSAMTMEEWAARARAMKQATPDSVVDRLRTAEDEAVKQALKERQKMAEAALKARLEAEAAAHREAQERKAEEARMRLTRARLVAYYRRYNPTKESNVDKILETYKDNLEVLDAKLRKKYGTGFNPAVNPNKKKKTMTEVANESVLKTMQTMNEGMKKISIGSNKIERKDNPLDDDEETDDQRKQDNRVSVSVKVGEILPFICMSREQANDIRRTCLQKDLPMPLRFYLVDARSEEAASQQGRFPTAARLSPDTLMDPEQLQQYEESFETVRGTFHICVMGEGHSAIPALYNQHVTPQLEEYMREDESKTTNCALFFVKRGFPFVSVLEGGFAAAHAWLVREGGKKGFDTNALLVDYDPDVSVFGQMEKIRMGQKSAAAYKTQRALQSVLDQSLAAFVRGKMQLDGTLAAEVGAAASIDGTAPAADKTSTKNSTNPAKSSEESKAAAGISSFFGRAVAPAGSTDNAEAPAAAAAADENQNRFSRWKQVATSAINAKDEVSQSVDTSQAKAPAAVPATNRFGGFGFGSAAAKAQPMMRRNPFARFGSGGPTKADPASTNGTKASSGLGGLMKIARTTSTDSSGIPKNNMPTSMARSTSVDGAPTPTIVDLPPPKTTSSNDTEKEGEGDDKPAAPAASIKAV